MMPEAPVRFSTRKFCFSESVSLAAKRRASGSTEPPGGYGETNLTTLVGQSWEKTGKERLARRRTLKTHIPSSFEFQHLPGIVWRRDYQPQLFQYAARLRYLLGVRSGELPAPDPQAVLEADAHIAAHHRRLRRDLHLRAAGAEHGPQVLVAEQAIRGALHVD